MRKTEMRSPHDFRRHWAVGAVCSGLLATLVAGCSLVTDTSESQCKNTLDCLNLFGLSAPYLCDTESSYCVRPACQEDVDCRRRGENFVSSICGSDKFCAAGECTVDDHCGIGGVCDSDTNRCVERQCRVLADCQSKHPSPTVQCVEGRCVEEVWGCIGEPDNRTATMPTATIKLPFLELISRMPIEGTVIPCLLPQFDPAPNPGCTPVAGALSTFDAATGVATISNLPQGAPVRLYFTPKPAPSIAEELMPVDYYSQRTPRDVTEYPVARIPYVIVVQALSGAFDPPVAIPLESAGATINIFDCRGMPAEGVFFRDFPDNERLPDTRITYFGEGGLPNPAQMQTDKSGLASVINMKQRVAVTLRAEIRGTPLLGQTRTIPMTEFPVTLFGSRMAIIELHPRKYRQ
jgi:hypothetical protein